MTYPELVQPLIERKDLSPEQASALMRFLMSGEATDAQIGGILLGLRIKGCTTAEIAAFVTVMREKATIVDHEIENLVDTCGTGGGRQTFNISTAAAIVACAAGVKVAKHGNRSVTGQGSADVLEALEIPIQGSPEELLDRLDRFGIAFLFAPAHHPAMKHVAKARRELELRTVFNQLGPLANPASAKRQLIGVYDPRLMRSMGEALKALGTERALIVHAREGIDEVSPCGETEVVKVWEGRISTEVWTPRDFGLEPIAADALQVGKDLRASAQILVEAVTDPGSPRAKAILPSAGAAVYLSGLEPCLADGTFRAMKAIADGLARAKLDSLVEGAAR